ncbi:MAG: helix-turn-helix domain-containing protein [Pseudobdellovibrionaceae bacterium]
MKKTGEILKKAREEKGLSLQEVSLSLKISSKVLKAIEEGDELNLPAKTFLRGFVQSYSNFLHLNLNEMLEIFQEEMGSTKPKPYIRPASGEATALEANVNDTATSTEKPSGDQKSDSLKSLHEKKNTKTIAITLLGFVLVGFIVFTKKMIDKYTKEAEVPKAEVQQTIQGATPVIPEATPVPINPAPTSNSNNALNSLPDGTATAPMPMEKATPEATPAAPVAHSEQAENLITPTPQVPAVLPAKPAPKQEEGNKPVELIVEALDAVEIEYSAPNSKPQKIKLSAEQVHTFKSKSGLKINFSNGGAVNLIHNGKEIGIPGDLGKPIKLSY